MRTRRKSSSAEKQAIKRAARILERTGHFVGLATGALKETFDLIADPLLQDPSKDSGSYVRIAIEEIPADVLQRIRTFETSRKKELWILKRSSEKKNDPKYFEKIFIAGERMVSPEARALKDLLKKLSSAKSRVKSKSGVTEVEEKQK